MRKSTLFSAALLLIGLLAADPSFGAKGRFFAHGNNKLGKNTLSVKQARLAVANAINLQYGKGLKSMRMRVKPEQIKITLEKTADGKVLFAAKLKADGRTRQAKKFKAAAEFRGVLDVSLINPSDAAIRDAAYTIADTKDKNGNRPNWGKGQEQDKRNWEKAKRLLQNLDVNRSNRVQFFSGKIDSKFNDIAKTLK